MEEFEHPDAALNRSLADAFANPKAGKAMPSGVSLADLMGGSETPPLSSADLSAAFDNPKSARAKAVIRKGGDAAVAAPTAGGATPRQPTLEDLMSGGGAPVSAAALAEAFANPKAGRQMTPERPSPDHAHGGLADAWADPKRGLPHAVDTDQLRYEENIRSDVGPRSSGFHVLLIGGLSALFVLVFVSVNVMPEAGAEAGSASSSGGIVVQQRP